MSSHTFSSGCGVAKLVACLLGEAPMRKKKGWSINKSKNKKQAPF